MSRKPINGRPMTAAERQRRHREMVPTEQPMTRAERDDLQRVIRGQERVLKTAAAQRGAELLADFEQQLASVYSYDQDEVWRALTLAAEDHVQRAKAAIADRCRELGIPDKFAPTLHLSWQGRGENAQADRRSELRRVAVSRIAAIEKEAITKIERYAVDTQTRVIAYGLASTAAKTFLENLPRIESLMPPLDAAELAKLHAPARIRGASEWVRLPPPEEEP
jgi:hypothetical protein